MDSLKTVIHIENRRQCPIPENMAMADNHKCDVKEPVTVEGRENPERPERI
jgi:hypothetical protein